MNVEGISLWAALLLYVIGGSLAILGVTFDRHWQRAVCACLLLALVVHACAIGLRWERVGHGPFITMFEILSSNIWSLTAIYMVCYLRMPEIRPAIVFVIPVVFLLMGWLLISNPSDGHFPPTYRTIWLYVHVFFGKIFLGSLLIAVGLSGLVLARRIPVLAAKFAQLPTQRALSTLAFRFVLTGFLFESLMLIAGAIWAQDAWGRYWAWDPLETWAFLTWLCVALYLHARHSYKFSEEFAAATVITIFVVAFLTFFGVPFISTAPHKGAI